MTSQALPILDLKRSSIHGFQISALGYRADFVCFNQAQVLNYLKGAGLKRGLLLNFGQTSLQYRRLVRGPPRAEDPRVKD